MEFISQILGPFGWIFTVVLPFLVVLGVVIFVHEYGHYIVGRWCGIHADAFSIGFGPEIVGWTDKRGTRWRVAWIPLGGYVQFRGDANASSAGADAEAMAGMSAAERRSSLPGAPLWARASTVAAGPAANFLLTMVLFTGVVLYAGTASEEPVLGEVATDGQAYGAGLRSGDRILSIDGEPVGAFADFLKVLRERPGEPLELAVLRDGAETTVPMTFAQPTRVSAVAPGTPAYFACLVAGDVIQAVDGKPVSNFKELQDAVLASGGRTLSLTVERAGEGLKTLKLTPEMREYLDRETQEIELRPMIGVSADANLGVAPKREAASIGAAVAAGVARPFEDSARTVGYIAAIFSGKADGSSLGGPIGIARMSSQAAEIGVIGFIVFIATISAAIGFINLLPIPILDGGHLVFYALEAVRGEPLSERAMNAASTVGLVAILALMVFATTNDLSGPASSLVRDC